MKILHCIYSLQGGGAERQLKMLAEVSSNSQVEFAIFCIDDSGNDIKNDKVKIFKITSPENYPKKTFFEIKKTIEAWQPDIVQSWLPPSITIPTMCAALITKKPCITSYRNRLRFDSLLRVPDYLCQLFLSNKIISNSIVSHSAWQYRALFKFKNGVIISNAVDVREEYRKQYSERDCSGVFKIIFVGRLTQQKNWQTLFKAVQLLGNKNWELKVCGDGEQREQAEAFVAEHDLGKHIKLLGYRDDVYQLMTEAHLMVLPSFYEGMPNVVLEAMAIGLPCILSDIDAHRDLLGHTKSAVLVPTFDYRALFIEIDRLREDNAALQEMSLAGHDISKLYTAKVMMEQYLAVYKDMLS